MAFAGINLLAVLISAIAAFIFGAVWYGVLGKQWMAALGKTGDQLGHVGAKPPMRAMVTAGIALLLMAWVLAGVMGHLGPGNVTLRNGLITGLFIWAGFVLTTLAVNHGFQGARHSLTLIDGGHWLGVLLIQGAVLGLFGV